MPNSVYPIFLHRMRGVRVVVIGGGKVGERKVEGLLAVGALVRLISPQATDLLQQLASDKRIEWIARPYQSGDLDESFLAFVAINQRSVNAQVAVDAAQQHILCNIADAPGEGDFHLPALHRTDELTIAVGTNGANPSLAKQVRTWIGEQIAGKQWRG